MFPNAVSTLIQYLSLSWPPETTCGSYNSLQLLAYFITIFLAAPLAFITGLGMSPALSTRFRRISSVLSIQTARSLHFLVLVWFLLFIVLHVALVFTTGLLHNLNHVYANNDGAGWAGFWVFAASMVIVVVGWVAATPFTFGHPRVVQRVGYALIGPAQRLFEHLDAKPGQYTEADISPYFWHNGRYPDSAAYTALQAGGFLDYPAADQRPRRPPSRAGPHPTAGAAASGADYPALLHPGLVGHRQMGAGCRCRPSSTSSNPPRRRSGWCSTPWETAPTAASTRMPTRSSRCPVT